MAKLAEGTSGRTEAEKVTTALAPNGSGASVAVEPLKTKGTLALNVPASSTKSSENMPLSARSLASASEPAACDTV
jgi:hypothetical protein